MRLPFDIPVSCAITEEVEISLHVKSHQHVGRACAFQTLRVLASWGRMYFDRTEADMLSRICAQDNNQHSLVPQG